MFILENNIQNTFILTLSPDSEVVQTGYTMNYTHDTSNYTGSTYMVDEAVELSATTRYNQFTAVVSGSTGSTGYTYIIVEDVGDYTYSVVDYDGNEIENGKFKINSDEYTTYTTYRTDTQKYKIYK